MNKIEFARNLAALLEEHGEEFDLDVHSTTDFKFLLTRDEGVIVTLENGDEFQVTVVQSKWGYDREDEDEDEDEEW